MRFKPLIVGGFAALIFLTLLLLSGFSLQENITLHIAYALVISVILIVLLITDQVSRTHLLVTLVLFLSLGGLILQLMGKPTLTTFFLGGMFILTYMFTIAVVLLAKPTHSPMFDKMLSAKERREQQQELRKKQIFVPVESIIDEPPRISLDRKGRVKVTAKKKTTRKKSSRKKR